MNNKLKIRRVNRVELTKTGVRIDWTNTDGRTVKTRGQINDPRIQHLLERRRGLLRSLRNQCPKTKAWEEWAKANFYSAPLRRAPRRTAP
jgi:hypothetical protein